jgi:hypothetical protein
LTTTIEETTRSTHQEINFSLLSWCLSVIPALGKLRQEDHESKTNMGYTVRPYLKKKRKIPWAGRVAQVVECLLCKCKALSSNLAPALQRMTLGSIPRTETKQFFKNIFQW